MLLFLLMFFVLLHVLLLLIDGEVSDHTPKVLVLFLRLLLVGGGWVLGRCGLNPNVGLCGTVSLSLCGFLFLRNNLG